MTTAHRPPAASLQQHSDDGSATTPEFDDIQKLIVHGFDFHCSRNLVLTVNHVLAARKFLGELHGQHWLVSANRDRDWVKKGLANKRCPVSLGLTFEGLRVLGLPGHHQDIFKNRARAFAEGAFGRAASQLADVGPSGAVFWNPAFRPHQAHVLLILHADTPGELDASQARLKTLADADAFESEGWTKPFEGAHLEPQDDKRKSRLVHFELLDGLSQPAINTSDKSPRHPTQSHSLGEFVLGYPNDAGLTPWRLASERPDLSGVASLDQSKRLAEFFRNASFGAFRPMEQDVSAFNAFVDKQADTYCMDLDLGQDKAKAIAFIRAKLVGRWNNGAVVKPGQKVEPTLPVSENQAKTPEELNNFDFSDDKQGTGCPFGAHIRRMNPRQDAVIPLNARPLLRRGIPYGPTFEANPKSTERGLLGLFFCASLEDQFEHVLSQWADDNPMGPPNRGNAQDPLIGAHNRPGATFDIPQDQGGRFALDGFTPFVRTVGTLYAFFPGLKAVKFMATGWGRRKAD